MIINGREHDREEIKRQIYLRECEIEMLKNKLKRWKKFLKEEGGVNKYV